MTGRNPVDRGKPGSKIHLLSDRAGLPLATAMSAATTHDSHALGPLVKAIPAIRSPRGRAAGDRASCTPTGDRKAYDNNELRAWLRGRGIIPRIARKGIESSTRLGLHRWVIERTVVWTFGYRRLTIRHERKASHSAAFLALGAALPCYKKLTK